MNADIYEKGIAIYWYNTIEFINIDCDKLNENTEIPNTKEWDLEDQILRKYNTISSVKKVSDSIFEIQLQYKPNRNNNIPPAEVCWGVSVIQIVKDDESGYATWTDDNDSNYNGKRKWRRIDLPLIGKRRRITSTKLQRDQARFRNLLLSINNACAITGEKTFDVLEAAHIIPVSNGGTEAVRNGIILRSDIHKLYDSGKIDISTNGEVIIKGDISNNYIKLLKGARLGETVLNRIKEALEKKKEENL
jgi:hypothetical protein